MTRCRLHATPAFLWWAISDGPYTNAASAMRFVESEQSQLSFRLRISSALVTFCAEPR